MGPNTGLTTVVLITKNPLLTKDIQQALDQESGFVLLKSVSLLEELFSAIDPSHPHIILVDYQLDHEQSTLDAIDKIASRYLSAAVVTILPETQVQLSDRVILAGARAILVNPFSKETLINTLRRVRELLFRNPGILQDIPTTPARTSSCKCVVVYSPKGGAGCTTVAINLAIALHQQTKEKVLLVDGRHTLGHVALMLNLRTGNSITDLLAYAEKLDDALINQVVVDHVSGIIVLTSPSSFERGQDIKPEQLYKVFQALREIYPIIVVDGGSYLDDNLVTYMDMADSILMVLNPNLASLRDARQFLNFSRTLSYSEQKILLVLNQSGHKADVKLSEIEKVLHSKILGTIPADEDLMLSCLNDGVPVILKKSNHAISKGFKALATSLLSKLATLSTRTADKSNASADILRKSSYLG